MRTLKKSIQFAVCSLQNAIIKPVSIAKLVLAVSILMASACTSTYHAQTSPDDVYYTTGDPQPAPPPAVSHSTPANSDYSRSQRTPYSNNSGAYSSDVDQANQNGNQGDPNGGSSSSQQYRDSSGNNITNNYYNGDYYDYGYTSRLRRFYSPMYDYGYYDPYYSDPYFYGPSFRLSIGYGFGFGYGYSPFYNPFYNPFWPYYGFGLGYYGGYYGGFYSPYYAGYYNPYYYGYEGVTNYHYGPRGSLSGNGRTVLPAPRGGVVSNPVVNPRGTQSPAQNINSTNVTPTAPTNGVVNSDLLKNTNGATGIISQKNANGGTRLPVNTTSTVAPFKGGEVSPVPPPSQRNGNISTANQSEMSHGGTVRPNIAPQNPVHPGGQVATPNSKSQNSNLRPQPNSGGTVRPNYQQPMRGPNQYAQPGNQQRNYNQQRSWNNARSNRSYDSPRQYRESQPRMQPHMEQRNFSAPSHNFSAPSHGGGGGGGGGSRGSSHSGGGGRR